MFDNQNNQILPLFFKSPLYMAFLGYFPFFGAGFDYFDYFHLIPFIFIEFILAPFLSLILMYSISPLSLKENNNNNNNNSLRSLKETLLKY